MGFEVYNLGRIACASFEMVFSRWSDGAPNCHREEERFYKEEEAEWTVVRRRAGDHRNSSEG